MKTFYKTQSFLVMIILFFCYTLNSKTYAQYQYLDSANLELRHIFSQITYPDNDILFLNERSAKLSDSLLYQINNPDTIHQLQWYQVYKEMYYAAHDTLTQVPFNDLMVEANNYGPDTIPMGIMDWQFYRVKYDAINTSNYFTFDLTNNYFLDHPSPIASPYTVDNIFIATPMLHQANFLEVTFAINPDFIFRDGNTIYDYYTPNELQIDFGDGNGFITINPNSTSYITVEYPTNGEKVIQTRLFSTEGEFVVKSSNSRLFINNNSLPIRPDYVLNNIPGMNVGVYNSCQDGVHEKKVILVEGFDFFDEIPSLRTGIEQIYYDNIKLEELQHLRNFGYSYYVVDWKDSKTDMRYNALNLLCLIEYLKANSDNDEEFVIVGISMGGVIARYTLNFMESSHYQTLDFSPFFVENSDPYNQSYLAQNPNFPTAWQELLDDQLLHLNHNTRLLITIDSPHQGANIPLAYQYIYRFAENTLGQIIPGMLVLTHAVPQLSILQILNKKSPRQLLKWYVHPGASAFSVNSYGPNSSHTSFYNQLKSFSQDGVPTYAKMVALSDGALDGSPQQDPRTNYYRNYNDYILDYELNTTVKILWIPFTFLDARVDARTNPNGSGQILSGSFGTTNFKIKIKLFGIKITTSYIPIIPLFYAYALNTQPTCVTAGGHHNVFDINNSSYNGNWDVLGGFLGFSIERITESNGAGFCFVPLESALDYRGSQAFNNDILNENINTKLANTPFDVIAGQVTQGYNHLTGQNVWSNHKHTANRNEHSMVYNLTQQPAAGANAQSDQKYAYYTCAAVENYEAKRTFLSQEIGDEELYLENFITNRTTSYRTEFDIKVNHRNPYYEYPSQQSGSTTLMLDGIYSKEDDFDIASGGFATFYYDSSSPSLPNPGLDINYLNSPDYTDVDEPYGICCTAPSARMAQPIVAAKSANQTELAVYPNPTINNGLITIDATLNYNEPFANLIVMDISGKQLFTKQLIVADKKLHYKLSVADMRLAKGVYFVKVATKRFSQTNKLIIY